ncbi:MAG: hypothetical protein A2X48_22265 [Lentisphaerae bacterium GWF2_49_21]|nr:MAG: hypothetical protein A2X48_22265 [Lentisphaerae bacterium GWF2_49_21]
MNAIVSEKGQVTIPKILRNQLGIRSGTVLDFREEDGRLVAIKQAVKDTVTSARGCLKSRKRTDAVIREMRKSS